MKFYITIFLSFNLLTTFAQTPTDYFITKWDLSKEGTTGELDFPITTAGDVNYSWETIPAGTTGTGIISGTTATIIGLPTNAIIRLKIDPVNFTSINFYGVNLPNVKRLIDVEQWGTVNWTTMAWAFSGCWNLNITATDLPNLSGLTDMSYMFYNCIILNGPPNINSWNTSNITNMRSLFNDAYKFNQPIGNWNTSNVSDMSGMFFTATSFNQSIGNWNVSNVSSMSNMFQNATAFNQSIENWDVTQVNSMIALFGNAHSFNQPLNNWNVANVNYMNGMFSGVSAFNQNIGNWNLNPNVNMSNMFDNSGMDCNNYTDTIIGWSNNPSTPNNRNLGAVGMNYGMNALSNRDILISGKGWTINGDIQSSGNCGSLAVENFSEKTFEIYPNPTDGFIIVNTEESGIGTIFNSLGQLMKTVNLDVNKIIDLSDFPIGIYTLEMKCNGKSYCKKLIKK